MVNQTSKSIIKIAMSIGAFPFVLFTATVVEAQTISPAFPLIVKQYGLFGSYSTEAVLTSNVPLNPARQGSVPAKVLFETDYGTLQTGGLATTWKLVNLSESSRRTSLRLSYNALTSNTAAIPASAPLLFSHSGDSLELVCGYHLSHLLDIGGAVVPEDLNRGSLTASGDLVAYGKSRSTGQGRIGAYLHSGQFGLGGETGWEKGVVNSSIEGAATPAITYSLNHTTWGTSWHPALGTILFYNKQNAKLEAPIGGIDSSINTDFWGVNQWASTRLDFCLDRSGTGNGISATYLVGSKSWVSISYTKRAYSSSEQYVGRGDLLFFSLDIGD